MICYKEKKSSLKSGGSSLGEAAKYSVCAIFILMGALAYIWPKVMTVKLVYEKDKLRRQNERLILKNRLMRIEKASLISLDKIENMAVKQLKMVFPDDSNVVIVRDSGKE